MVSGKTYEGESTVENPAENTARDQGQLSRFFYLEEEIDFSTYAFNILNLP